VDLAPWNGLQSAEILSQRTGRVNRIRSQIGELTTLREQVASDELVPLILSAPTGTGKSTAIIGLASSLKAHVLRPRLFHAGSRVPIDAEAIEAAQLRDGIAPTVADLAAISQATQRSPAAVLPPYRPAHQWLRLGEFPLPSFPA
jgi:hypothetical protein